MLIGARVRGDNVFAPPRLLRPLQHGADVVIYSATKHIDGQGRCLGGAVLCSEKFLTDHLQDFFRQTGPSMSPFNAWVMLKGLETMPLRVRAQCQGADIVARHLVEQKAVTRVLGQGLRTGDIMQAGKTKVGTREMGEAVLKALEQG